jgi:hypothetical protein
MIKLFSSESWKAKCSFSVIKKDLILSILIVNWTKVSVQSFLYEKENILLYLRKHWFSAKLFEKIPEPTFSVELNIAKFSSNKIKLLVESVNVHIKILSSAV